MGFFDNIKRTVSRGVSQLDFWDGEENARQRAQFAREDEERKRREQQIIAQQRAQAAANIAAQRAQREQQAQQQVQQARQQPLVRNPLDPLNRQPQQPDPTAPMKPQGLSYQVIDTPAPLKPQVSQQQIELNQLAQKHTAQAEAEAKRGNSWLNRTFLDRGWDERAQNTARGRAVAEYQQKHGYNQDPEVMKFLAQTTANAEGQSKKAAQATKNLDEFDKNFTKAAEVASYVPITGTVMDWGLRAIGGIGPNAMYGFDKVGANARDKYKQVQLGMTQAEYNALDDDTQHKLDVLMGAGSAAGVLDFTGIGGILKTGGKIGLKKAVTELIEKQGLKQATKTALTKGSKHAAKEAAPAFVAGTGLAVGAQGYLGGFDQLDPLEALRTGAMVAGTSLLDPSQGTRNVVKRSGLANAVDEAGDVTSDVQAPNPNEVAPGVVKSPTAPKPAQALATPPPAAVTAPVPTPPVEAPVVAPTPPPSILPTPRPEPVTPQPGQTYSVPQTPQTINPEIQKAVAQAQAGVDEAATAPVVKSDVPDTAPVETPIQAASKAAPAPVVVDEKGVTTKQLTPEEMRARGMSEEAIANVMARRANPEAVKKEDAPDPAVEAAKAERLRAEAQAAADAGEGTKAGDLKEHAGIDPVTTEPIEAPKPAGRSKKERALEVINGASSRSDKVELYKEAKARGLIDTEDIPKEFRKDVLSTVATEGMLPAKARGQEAKTVAPVGEKTTSLPSKPEKARVAKDEATPVEDPTLTTKPTAQQLQTGARENTNKSGKVSQKWINEQIKNGADPMDLFHAVEKVNGKTVPDTAEQKLTKAQRAKANAMARAEKEKAKAEGKTMQAAPKLTKELADQAAKETGDEASKAATARSFKAYTRKINIEEETAKAAKKVDEVSDGNITKFAEEALANADNMDDPEYMFLGDAISARLDKMRRDGKISYDDMLDVAAKIEQGKAIRASQSGQVQRITRELYGRVPAPVRVKKELQKMTEHYEALGKDFKPTKEDEKALLEATDNFDAAAVRLSGAEAKMDSIMADMTDPDMKLTDAEVDAKKKEFDGLVKEKKAAQTDAVEASHAYTEKMNSIKPKLSAGEKMKSWALGAPDAAGNYLRMSMLSAPSGRIRDVFSTTFNVIDQAVWRTAEALTGGILNKTVGTSLIESMGSNASRSKGRSGAWDKVKASWKGEYTLDEATGRSNTHDRSELKGKDSISIFGSRSPKPKQGLLRKVASLPKRVITTSVQVSTDLSYGVYTDRLYANGLKAAKENGLKGKQAQRYAEMFMERPNAAGMKDAAQVWLENSGMHDNFISRNLTRLTDALDKAGSKKDEPVKVRVAKKALARTIRTTTIPFVQYLGGATHAMLIKQNPLANVAESVVAMAKKDPQKAIEHLSRGGWNAVKIGTLTALVSSNTIEISETDADGEAKYNGPYVVHDGQYIPASSYGIALGSAIIGAHYINKAKDDFANGDIVNGYANSTLMPFLGTLKASGMDNMLSGSNVFGGLPANVFQTMNNGSKEASDVAKSIFGGMIGDLGTQASPAALRDVDSFLNQDPNYNPTGETADSSGKGANGKVDPLTKGIHQVMAGIPGLSDNLPRKSGSNAKTFTDRIFNSNTQSNQQVAAITAKKGEEAARVDRVKSIFDDENMTNLLSPETRAIHDKYKGKPENVSKGDMDKMWKEVKDGQNKLLEDGEYESYATVLRKEHDELKAKGNASETELQKHARKITRAEVAGSNGTDPQIFRLYTGIGTAEGAGISQTELNKMMDPEDENYDPTTAAALWDFDQLLTAKEVSFNSNGVDPWKRAKYKVPKNGWGGKGGGGGGSGGKTKQIATDFGMLGSFAKPSDDNGLKYRKLTTAVPNLTSQSSKTNLKKKISVVKGVKL